MFDDNESDAIVAITVITILYVFVAATTKLDAATTQLVSTAIGGILGVAAGKANIKG